MSKRLVIEPEAEADMAAAYEWYENQRPGPGDDFALCIEAAPSAIAQRPKSFPPVHKAARRVLVHRFPYFILFVERRSAILVVGVFHTRRDPAEWHKRLS